MAENNIRLTVDTTQAMAEVAKVSRAFGKYSDETARFSKAISGALNSPKADPMTKYLASMMSQIKATTQASFDLAKSMGGRMTESMRVLESRAYSTTKAIGSMMSGWKAMDASQRSSGIANLTRELDKYGEAIRKAQAGPNSKFQILGKPSEYNGLIALMKDMTAQLNALGNAGQTAALKVAKLTSVKATNPAGASNSWYSDKALDQYYAKQSSTMSGGSAYSDSAIRERQGAIVAGLKGIEVAAKSAAIQVEKVYKTPAGASNAWNTDDFLSKFKPKASTITSGGAAYDDIKIREAQQGMAKLAKETDKVGEASKKAKEPTAQLLGTFGKIAKYTVGYKIVDWLLGLPEQVIRTAAAMEQLRAGFEGVFGKKAAAEFQYVIDMSNKYGKALEQVAPSYQKFAASTDYLGISGDQSKRIFETVTQTITKIGGSTEDVRGTLTAMQQMLSKGTVMSEEFRLQFAERIPGAMKMGANAMGTTVEGFKKMMEQGGVLASEFLPKLVTEMEKFSTGWEKSADTLQSNWTRLGNSFQVLVSENSGSLTKMLNDTIKWATATIEWYSKASKTTETFNKYSWYQNKGFEGFGDTSSIKDMKSKLDAYEGMDIPGQIARIEAALTKANERSDIYGSTVAGDAQLERLLEYKEQALYIQDTLKAIDGVKAKLASGLITGDAAAQANKWLNEAADSMEKLHQPRPDINFRPHVDVSEIVGAINLINQLYQKTKDFQVEAAATTLDAVERSTQKVEEFVQENQKVAQAASGSGGSFMAFDRATTNINTGTEALKKQKAVVTGLTKDLQDKTIALAKDGEMQRQYDLDKGLVKGKDKDSKKALIRSENAANLEYLQNLKKAAVDLGDKAPYSVEQLDKAIVDLGNNTKTALAAVDKEGTGAAGAADRLITKVDSLAWRMKKFNAESRGDSMTAGLMGIEEEYTNKLAELDRLGKKSGKGADEARAAAEATKIAQQAKVTAENYEKSQNALSGMLSTYAQLTDNPAIKQQAEFMKAELEYGAKTQQNLADSIKASEDQLAITEGKGKLEGVARDNAEKYLEVLKQIAELNPKLLEASKQRTVYEAQIAVLNSRSKYAEMMGDSQGYYAAQVAMKEKELELSKQSVENLEKTKVLQEELLRLQARKDMNVGKLVEVGMARAATKAYEDLADKIENAIPSALDSLGESISSNLGDLASGAQTAEQAFASMGKQMRASIMQLVIDLGMAIVKMQMLKGIAGVQSDVNVDVNGVSGSSQQGQSKYSSSSGGLNPSSLLNMGGGNGIISGIDSWGYSNLGIGSVKVAADGTAAGTNASIVGGLGSIGSGALMGGGIGYGLSSLFYSNGTATVGGTLGGAVGGAVGAATLGTALGSFAGPIGAIVGGALGSILSGSETKTTSKTGQSGITINMMSAGKSSISGWEGMRTTTSGFMGSSSTKHFKQATVADPELTAAWNEGMIQVTNTLEKSLKTLNIGIEPLKNFTFPIEFDLNSEVLEKALYNISNAMAENSITAAGLKEEFDATAKEGEMYIDQIKRISEAYSSVVLSAELAGASLEQLSGSLSKIIQGDYASQFIDRMGSVDSANAAFSRIQKHSGKTPAEQAQAQMMVYGRVAGEQLAYLGDQSVNFSNFWSKFAEARANGMSVSKLKEWSDASAAVDAFEQSFFQAETVRVSLLQDELTVLQESASALEDAVSKWEDLVSALKDAREDLLFDKNLSSLSPEEVYNQKRSKFLDLKTRAQGGDQAAITELATFSKDFIEESRSYYGASAAYYADFNMVTDTLGATQTIAEQQLSVANAQLAALNTQIALHQHTILELQNMANGLFTVGAGMDAIAAKMGLNTGAAAAIQAANEAQVAAFAAIAYVAPQQSQAPAAASTELSGADSYAATLKSLGWGSTQEYVPAFANGGLGTGLALVGEDGPEFIRFKTPGNVFSNKKSGLDMPSLASGLDNIAQTTAAGALSTTNEVAQLRAEVKQLTKAIRRMADAR